VAEVQSQIRNIPGFGSFLTAVPDCVSRDLLLFSIS